MPAYIPPHLRKKGPTKLKKSLTKKQVRFPSNTTGESSRNVSFGPVSKLFSDIGSSVYRVFSSSFETRKLRKKSLTKVLKTGKQGVLRRSSASPLMKQSIKKKGPASA